MKTRNIIYSVFSIVVTGCSGGIFSASGDSYSGELPHRYKYDVLPERNGVERYYFGFRRDDILLLGNDRERAILKFIES